MKTKCFIKTAAAMVVCATAALALCNTRVNAQGLGINNPTPHASALLDLTSATRGLLVPRMITADRDAIGSPATSLLIFNTSTNAYNYWNGTAWVSLLASSGASWSRTAPNVFLANTGDSVGIGTSSPNAKLQITTLTDNTPFIIQANATQSNTNPLIKLRNSAGADLLWINSDNTLNTFIGLNTGRVNTGTSNTFIGSSAGYSTTSGNWNTASGNYSLYSNLSGTTNAAFGYNAGYANTASGNTFVGNSAGSGNNSGTSNTFIGNNAGTTNSINSNVTYIGYQAGVWATGGGNTTLGSNAGGANLTSGINNTFIGYNADLAGATQRSNVTAIGYNAKVDADNALVLGGTGVDAVSVGIGINTPTSILHTVASGAKTAAYTGNLLTNTATSSTASINKTGLDIQSTGLWSGASAVNTGLNVNATGGTTNYSAIFQGGNVGIGTTAPATLLHLNGTGTEVIRIQSSSATANIGIEVLEGATARGGFFWDGTNGVVQLRNGTGGVGGTLALNSLGGNVGIGTTTPTYALSFGGDVARTIWMERNTLAATPVFRIEAAGATVGATDRPGGVLQLSSGISTGNVGSGIVFLTATSGGISGTTDRTPTQKMVLAAWGGLIIGQGVTNQLAGDLLLIKDGHFGVQQTTAPTIAVLPGAGNDPSVTASILASSTDNAGQFTLTSHSFQDAIGDVCTITFNKAFTTNVIVVITPANGIATTKQVYVSTTTTTAFTVGYNVLPAVATCIFNYLIIGNN